MPADDLEKATPRRRRHLWATWPTDLPDEWQHRTRYGKCKFLMMLPPYVAGWVMLVVLAGIMAVGYYGLVVVWKIGLMLSDWWPSTHRGESSAE